MKLLEQEKIRLLLEDTRRAPRWMRLFKLLLRGRLSPEEAKTLLLLCGKRGTCFEMIWSCLKVIQHLDRPRSIQISNLMDLCGTGGDGAKTFNISTVSSFVIAGGGGRVAKHGNRAVSSRVGSTDLMEALGINVRAPFKKMLVSLRDYGLAYFHAPFYHPSFAAVSKIRRQLGVRTLFNLLGPLVNPVRLRYQLVGVARSSWMAPAAEMLNRLGRLRAAVVRSKNGLDELSTYEANDILLVEGSKVSSSRLRPADLGFFKARKEDYLGGGLEANKRIALGILEGRLQGPRQDAVLLNSGFAFWLSGITASVKEGVEKSRWVIRSGRAREVLEGLRRITNT